MPRSASETLGMCNVLRHLAAYGATPGQLVEVEEAVNKVGATIPWGQILLTIMSDLFAVFMGQPLNIAAIIAQILALINPPAPAPTPAT